MNNDMYLFNYIKGNDLDNKEILQDDYRFMMKVIDITNDMNYYKLCTKNVRSNYNFVKFLINKFSFDKSFISVISYFYFQNNIINIKYKELLIIVNDLCVDVNNFCSYSNKVLLSAFYNSELKNINNYKKNNIDYCDIVQKGFIIIHKNYRESYIIMDYFAKRFINEIFIKNGIFSIEDFIYKKFNSLEQIKDYGINKFLINYIENYDMCLADYVRCNVELLDDIKLNLTYIEQKINNINNNLINFERKK